MSKRRWRASVIAAASLLVVMAVPMGCGSGDSGVMTYSDPDYGYSFDYPGDWQLATGDGAGVEVGASAASTVTVGDPEGASIGNTGIDLIMVRVYQLNQVFDASTLSDVLPYIETLLADLGSEDASWQTEVPLTHTTVGGAPAYMTSASFDWDSQTPMKTTSYFVFAGGFEYQVVMQAAAENWEEDQAVFDAFLASFRPAESAE
jgi:hypothetical protein